MGGGAAAAPEQDKNNHGAVQHFSIRGRRRDGQTRDAAKIETTAYDCFRLVPPLASVRALRLSFVLLQGETVKGRPGKRVVLG